MLKMQRTRASGLRDAVGPLGFWAALAVGATAAGGLLVAMSDGVATLPGATAVGVAVTRTAMDVAGVVVVGLAVLEVLLPHGDRRAAPVLERTVPAALAAAGGWPPSCSRSSSGRPMRSPARSQASRRPSW